MATTDRTTERSRLIDTGARGHRRWPIEWRDRRPARECRLAAITRGGIPRRGAAVCDHVLLVGRIEQDPQSRPSTDSTERLLRLAVRRRNPRSGIPEPGVSYLEIILPWPSTMDHSELRKGDLVAVSGLIERNRFRDREGRWQDEQSIVADWIELLNV